MNRKPDPKYDVLAQYAVAILSGQSLEKLAAEKGMTTDEMQKKLFEINEVNPPLYKQIQEKLGVSDH